MKKSSLKTNNCRHCGSEFHSSLMCFFKPKVPLKMQSKKTAMQVRDLRARWFEANPPDSKGLWTCYLQISDQCPVRLTIATVQLEHVKSRARHPELKWVVSNIKPACSFCNHMKGSRDLEEIIQ